MYRHFYERNPEAEKMQIEAQRSSNEERVLFNKKLRQKIDSNNDPEVQKNNRKLLAEEAVLRSEPKWVSQELQKRAQKLEEKNKEQRISILREIEIVKSLKSGDSDNGKKYDSIKSGLLNRYNRLAHGVDFATVRIGLSGNNKDND